MNSETTMFVDSILALVRNYETACRAIHKQVSESYGPQCVPALVMDARADTAKTLALEIEAEAALFKLGVPPARAGMPTVVTKMMWPLEPGGAL